MGDIIFAGNVGEEGRGDLRGIKALFRDFPDIDGFVSIDGVRLRRITTAGTGRRRFEFQPSGPGGHSFGAFGVASAIHAMGRAIAKIGDLEVPASPKTTFTVGTVDGGTSVNSLRRRDASVRNRYALQRSRAACHSGAKSQGRCTASCR